MEWWWGKLFNRSMGQAWKTLQCKAQDYFNRDIRQKSLTSMENMLNYNGITATVKQIRKKFTDLKNYYKDQKRMIESSKPRNPARNRAGADKSM